MTMLENNNNVISMLKTPPHSIEAEQMILGGLLLDEDSYTNIAGYIHEGHFYRKEHQLVFHHICLVVPLNNPHP